MSQLAPEMQTIIMLLTVVGELQSKVVSLVENNKELTGRLRTNSRNSSKPPPTNGCNKPPSPKDSNPDDSKADDAPERDEGDTKPNPKSLRQKPNNKPGGQNGHKGSRGHAIERKKSYAKRL